MSVKSHYTVKKKILFKKHQGLQLRGDLFKPRRAKDLPMVLMIHGGAWKSRTGNMESVCRLLASQGFVVFNTTYRFAPKHPFPAALEDVESALEFMRENGRELGGDPKQIFVWGYSAGGHLALLLGLNPSNKIKGIVAGGAPTNLCNWPGARTVVEFMGKQFHEDPDFWRKASPVNHVRKNSPPVFLYHGKKDFIVGINHMLELQEKLKSQNIPVQAKVFKWFGHFSLYLFHRPSVDAGIKFLRTI
ncbi:MAG: alpha/beta hydrolase [Bdellovibrionota bacterium]